MEKVYISDLDGTLLNKQGELSTFTHLNLKALIEEGLPFTVASARSIFSVKQMLRGLRLPLPAICFNGAYLSDSVSGEHHVVNSIDPGLAQSLFDRIHGLGRDPFLSTYDGSEEFVYYDNVSNPGMRWYVEERQVNNDPRFRRVTRVRQGLQQQVVCITLIDRKERLEELAAGIAEDFGEALELHLYENDYSPGWYWLTIHDAKASKDQAIETLKSLCGLEGSAVVAFGDNVNDIKMLGSAHHAIAVSNAAQEVKSHAQEIIGSNQQDSVVNYLLANWQPKP